MSARLVASRETPAPDRLAEAWARVVAAAAEAAVARARYRAAQAEYDQRLKEARR